MKNQLILNMTHSVITIDDNGLMEETKEKPITTNMLVKENENIFISIKRENENTFDRYRLNFKKKGNK